MSLTSFERHPDSTWKVIAKCEDCGLGYVSVNTKNPDPRCLACNGMIRLRPWKETADRQALREIDG